MLNPIIPHLDDMIGLFNIEKKSDECCMAIQGLKCAMIQIGTLTLRFDVSLCSSPPEYQHCSSYSQPLANFTLDLS
jgi:hypothetical protein